MANHSSLKTASDADGWRSVGAPGGRADLGIGRPASPPILAGSLKASPARADRALAEMIESEIIPRLMLAHRGEAPVQAGAAAGVGPRTLDTFLRLCVTREAEALSAFIDARLESGLPLEDVFTALLIPTARRLGDGWLDDSLSFAEVTLALSRLHQVVRTLSWRVPSPPPPEDAPSICLAPLPGAQHTFGLAVLEDGFRRAGWRTWLDPRPREGDTEDVVAHDWFDVFGLSVACDTPLDRVSAMLARVRAASCNPGLFVMLGGRLFCEHPHLAQAAGADATAADTQMALRAAERAVRPRVPG